ncbi:MULTISPECIES: hypothetical protein [Kocuria]|uniref:Uncharacterized protein n=1 Tax=Kocuria subflava TaxID=1736139 RepID=A0A846TLC7_9MICC|nr:MULTISPECIES: hypothetical protein [Kocuria]NKE09243.1 hypothetical protein [Kocuria subflava]
MTSSQSPVELLRSLSPGTRVTVRWALPAGDASGKRYTDSIGTVVGPGPSSSLLPDDDAYHDPGQDGSRPAQNSALPEGKGVDATGGADAAEGSDAAAGVLILETRRGRVEIPWEAVRLAKAVPPPPPRRAPQA